jgi:hypothetical protein
MIFNDGGIHIVNSSITPNSIEIRDGAGSVPTTVNVQAGAVIGSTSGSSISVFEHSHLNMSGGDLGDELFLFNSATATVSGGHIVDDITTNDSSSVIVNDVVNDDDFEARGASNMTINGGNHNEDVESFDTATVNISGGMFQTGADGAYVEAAGNSVINISGGTFGVGETDGAGGVNAIVNGVVNISGGDISGLPEGLHAEGNGVINVTGLGGQPARINATGTGVINFLDGPLQNLTASGVGVVTLKGSDPGSLTNIAAQDTVTIRIFGASFAAFNGAVPLPYGPIAFGSGNLSGVLADGTVFTNVPFIRNFGPGFAANIVLVPEPATMALGLAALTGVVAGARRRRKT